MPHTPQPKDRFDDLPEGVGRVGAHRAENPRIRAGVLVMWSAIAAIILIALGIFGTMVATGRITLFPTPEPTQVVVPTAEPTLDTSYKVTILNATPQQGLGGRMSDTLVAAGWSADAVTAGEAGSEDFALTTVFYSAAADEGAARGLAQAIGGASVIQSDAYDNLWGDDSSQLVLVVGLDRTTE